MSHYEEGRYSLDQLATLTLLIKEALSSEGLTPQTLAD